jgi:hypothetical protein
MNPTNLSIVFAPNLLRPEGDQLGLMLSDSAHSAGLMKTLIESFEFLFVDNDDHHEEKKEEVIPGSRESIRAASSPDVATEEIKRLTINSKSISTNTTAEKTYNHVKTGTSTININNINGN